MKFAISFFLCTHAFASPINLYYETDQAEAGIYRDVLMKDYAIPQELIELKEVSKCEEVKRKGKLDMCLKNNGDLYVVSVDRQFLDESLKVFKAP